MPESTKSFRPNRLAYGGTLLKKRKMRTYARPLATQKSMHLILRSTSARGDWSFWRKKNKREIERLVTKFASKYEVKIKSWANVGNHLHFHMRLTKHSLYVPFIRALTAAIAMTVTGASRLKKLRKRFWDYRPYTDIVTTTTHYSNLKKYIEINQLEAAGLSRREAQFFLAWHAAGDG